MQSLETSSVDESFNFWNHLRRTAMFAKKNNDPNNTVTVIGQRLGPEFIQTLEENLIPLNTPERRAKPMQTVVAPSKTTTASVSPASKVAGSGPQAISKEEESEISQELQAKEEAKRREADGSRSADQAKKLAVEGSRSFARANDGKAGTLRSGDVAKKTDLDGHRSTAEANEENEARLRSGEEANNTIAEIDHSMVEASSKRVARLWSEKIAKEKEENSPQDDGDGNNSNPEPLNDLQVILSTMAQKEPPSEMENSNATTPPRPKRKRNQDIDIAKENRNG